MHLGKPEAETLTTLFGGAGFGFIAWRTQSFYYGWLIHWFLGAFTMLSLPVRFEPSCLLVRSIPKSSNSQLDDTNMRAKIEQRSAGEDGSWRKNPHLN